MTFKSTLIEPFHHGSIHQYIGESGLKVVFINVPQTQYQFYCCIPTQDKCHDGKPHALEHLIFNGSKLYPCNDYLNQTIQRFVNNGTNAWTATDHTCYTAETIQQIGLQTIIPVFLNHIFYPTLTNEHFITEIYDGNGGGVVYNEMKAKENRPTYKGYHAIAKKMYPGTCFGSNTGGLTDCIKMLTIEQLRSYHADTYVPNRTRVILVGKFNATSIEKTLSTIVDIDIKLKHVNHTRTNTIFQQCKQDEKRFIEMVKNDKNLLINPNDPNGTNGTNGTNGANDIKTSTASAAASSAAASSAAESSSTSTSTSLSFESITYQDSSTTHGSLSIAFRGPPIHYHYCNTLLSLMMDSLVLGDDSLLQRYIMSNSLGSSVQWYSIDYSVKSSIIHIMNVPTSTLLLKETINKHVSSIKTLIKDMCDGIQSRQKMALDRIISVLDGAIIQYKYSIETDIGNLALDAVLANTINKSDDTTSFIKSLKQLEILKDIRSNLDNPSDMFKKQLLYSLSYLQPLHVLSMIPIRASNIPETHETSNTKTVTKHMVKDAIRINNANKCTKKNMASVDAIQHNIDDIVDVDFYNVTTMMINHELSIPRPIRGIGIDSKFIKVIININTAHLSSDERCCFAFLCQCCWFKSDIMYKDSTVSYKSIEKFIIENCVHTYIGTHPHCPNIVQFSLKFSATEKPAHYIHFILENIKNLIVNKRTEQLYKKRVMSLHGIWNRDMASLRDMHVATIKGFNNNTVSFTSLMQRYFLYNNKFNAVEEYINTVMNKLTIDCFDVDVVCNANIHTNKFTAMLPTECTIPEKPSIDKIKNYGYVIDEYVSAYLIISVPGVKIDHPLFYSIMVLVEYLSAHEGPIWDSLRGKGLAYTATMSVSNDEWIHAYIARSAIISQAYTAMVETIHDCVSNVDFDDQLLQPAKYALINDIIGSHECKWDVINGALNMPLNETNYTTYIQSIIRKIKAVNADSIRSCIPYFNQFNHASHSVVSMLGNKHHCHSLEKVLSKDKEFVIMQSGN